MSIRSAGLLAVALLILEGCSAITVQQARDALLGMTAPDLLACAGVPDKIQQISADELLVEYDRPADNAALFSLNIATMAGIAVGREGACHFHARILRDGTVSGISFSDTSFSFSGPEGDCQGLVAECVNHPDQTQLPHGYDVFSVLLPKDPFP